jgi:hypothetical protein
MISLVRCQNVVMSDILLSGATYIRGRKTAGMDLYDYCLVLIESDHGPILVFLFECSRVHRTRQSPQTLN